MITLTPNRRLSASLIKQFTQEAIASQKKCWETPVILPFSSWLENLWREYTLSKFEKFPRVLTPAQELIVWENLILQSSASSNLMQIAETAELAKSAWGLLKQYQLTLSHPKLDVTEDSAVFLTWAKAFQLYCDNNNFIDQHSLTDIISKKIEENTITVKDTIRLYGFTEICPQHQKLLSNIEKSGTPITYQHTEIIANSIQRAHLPDTETEMRNMALAAKTAYEKNPNAKIGCVVPNLEDRREMVLRIFSEVFTPKGFYTREPLTLPFNISAGRNLAAYPIIRTALTLLSLSHESLSLEKLSAILHSPFLGDAENEMLNRAAFTNQLYRANISTFTLKQLVANDAKPSLATYSPKLTTRFKLLIEQTPEANHKKSISTWIDTFVEWLTLLGWPGERTTNSAEHQAIKRWLELLNQFKQLDPIIPIQTCSRTLKYLIQFTKNDVFQPESPETSIQILGMLEAAELSFDQLWIMGMDDTTWPPSPKPNPFIPLHLQKNLKMPHASPERELQFCKAITEQLKKSAHKVLFTSALQNDETELRPSALIENLPETEFPIESDKTTRAAYLIFDHKNIEMILDHVATPVTDASTISGGTKIFELQAACPFKAFSEIRLYAKPVDALALGLRAIDRGIIVHKILEIFWKEIKDSKTLKSRSAEEIETSIANAIATTLKIYRDQKIDSTRYLALESIRLQKLIKEWIQLEMTRPDFTVISQEQTYSIEIGAIPVTLRIDRIDEVVIHGKLIIDYKTGKNIDIKSCFGDRPESLQLPLYCIIDPDNTVGIAYAKIHPEKMQLEGVSKMNLDINTIKSISEVNYSDATIWSEQIARWKNTLMQLSTDFCNGEASVDPKDDEITCEYCQLKPFCRIHEKYEH